MHPGRNSGACGNARQAAPPKQRSWKMHVRTSNRWLDAVGVDNVESALTADRILWEAKALNDGQCCCSLEALDKFAETRAVFSQEASSGMDEAFVDVRGCNYSNSDLTNKVFSGVLMRGADFANSKFVGRHSLVSAM